MSIYYWMVCDKHKESAPAVSSAGRGSPLHDAEDVLGPFIYTHAYCKAIRILAEDPYWEVQDQYELWTKKNLEEMLSKERDLDECNFCCGDGCEECGGTGKCPVQTTGSPE